VKFNDADLIACAALTVSQAHMQGGGRIQAPRPAEKSILPVTLEQALTPSPDTKPSLPPYKLRSTSSQAVDFKL